MPVDDSVRVGHELRQVEILRADGRGALIGAASRNGEKRKEGDNVWGTRGEWVNLTGIIDSKPVSLVILDHPSNVGFPTYWNARGYGLFAANPLGQKEFSKGKEVLDFKLPAGKSVTFRYKVLINSGSHLTDKQVGAEFEKFSKKK